MSTLLLKIDEDTKKRVEQAAQKMNISVDDLVNGLLHDFLEEKEARFQQARTHVRGRYRDLYKRLA
jgi:antitoxin component of RelBE/YafQ-DinJ toxin-antitoxin module